MNPPTPPALSIASEDASAARFPFQDRFQWGAARVLFDIYIGFALFTGIGGFLTAPVMTWYFYGDWRFWRYWRVGLPLLLHGYRMMRYIVQGKNGGFMLDVPLDAPPATVVDLSLMELKPDWDFGMSCGWCNRCCSKIKCPILDVETGLCRGYDSFFWRYFNCGRYPSNQREIDFYLCHKWRPKTPRPRPGANAQGVTSQKGRVA